MNFEKRTRLAYHMLTAVMNDLAEDLLDIDDAGIIGRVETALADVISAREDLLDVLSLNELAERPSDHICTCDVVLDYRSAAALVDTLDAIEGTR